MKRASGRNFGKVYLVTHDNNEDEKRYFIPVKSIRSSSGYFFKDLRGYEYIEGKGISKRTYGWFERSQFLNFFECDNGISDKVKQKLEMMYIAEKI